MRRFFTCASPGAGAALTVPPISLNSSTHNQVWNLIALPRRLDGPAMHKRESSISERDLNRRLIKFTGKQLRKLKTTYQTAAHGNDADAVHDLRVATRRLQTILDFAIFPKPEKRARNARKNLKKLRHALSVRRDTDVLTARMRSLAASAASTSRKRLWNRAAAGLKTRESAPRKNQSNGSGVIS
jgi:hypothetical protein